MTATTPAKRRAMEFVTLFRPHRAEEAVPTQAKLDRVEGGYVLRAAVSDGSVVALLPTDDSATVAAEGIESTGEIVVERRGADGSLIQCVRLDQ